jgi:hypothetical protein
MAAARSEHLTHFAAAADGKIQSDIIERLQVRNVKCCQEDIGGVIWNECQRHFAKSVGMQGFDIEH